MATNDEMDVGRSSRTRSSEKLKGFYGSNGKYYGVARMDKKPTTFAEYVVPATLGGSRGGAMGAALGAGAGLIGYLGSTGAFNNLGYATRSLIDNVISRFDAIEDREEPSVSTTTSTSTSSAGAPKPPEEEPDDTKNNKKSIRDLLWRKPSNRPPGKFLKYWSDHKADIGHWGIRIPLYTRLATGVAAPIIDLGDNIIGRAYTPDSVPYTMKFPVTKAAFALERGIIGLIGDAYKESPTNLNTTTNQTSTNLNTTTLSTLPAGFLPISHYKESTRQIAGPNSAGTGDTMITVEPLVRKRFGRGNNQNQ